MNFCVSQPAAFDSLCMPTGAFALSSRPHRWTFDSISAVHQEKRTQIPGGQPGIGGGGTPQLELTDS